MALFYPDVYSKDVFKVPYVSLKERGIRCLLFDLDNTLVSNHTKEPNQKLKELFAYLDDLGFKVILMSNSREKRVAPFKEGFNLDSCHTSMKPLKRKYKKIQEMFHYDDSEIACIGDQLLTDVLGANRMHFLSVLVDPLTNDDHGFTHVNRFIERRIYSHYEKKGLFQRGKYYE